MLTKTQFQNMLEKGPMLLDGATGSNLQAVGMPRGCCSEAWILENPQALIDLQARYVAAGSQIIYAPTFRALPMALAAHGLAAPTEKINRELIALSRQAAPNCLIAGNLTTPRGCITLPLPANSPA